MSEINRQALAQHVEAAARQIHSKMQDVHGPYWNARADLAKLIVSLSSAILAGTITFSGTLIGADEVPVCPSILILSWSCLLVSLISGVVTLWLNTTLTTFHVRFVNSGPELEQQIEQLDPASEDFAEQVVSLVGAASDRSLEPVTTADKWSYGTLRASLILFATGLLFFIVFGALQI